MIMGDAMQEWISPFSGFGGAPMEDVGVGSFLAIMAISVLTATFISFLYVKFYDPRATGSHVHRAFPLLGLSITGIFISIQFSLPLSLGLLGALSIVRFRTPIKEPEEIGFIMLVVATSLCCATFNVVFLGVMLATAVGALFLLRAASGALGRGRGDGTLVVTMPADEYAERSEELLGLLQSSVPRGRVDSVTEGRDEATVSYSFRRLDGDDLPAIQRSVRGLTDRASANVFFHRDCEV